MSRDLDFFLLDRVFQPAADAVAEWTSCFGLARICLWSAIILQTVVLAWDLATNTDALRVALVGFGTLAEYGAAQATLNQIGRAERQARPGTLNLARITLRPFRLLWVAFAGMGAVFWLGSSFRPVDFCNFLAGLMWVVTVYFMCCAATPPRRHARQGFTRFAAAGAS